MTDLNPGNAALHWTATFFRALQSRNVEHVIISPGSRSTPLTLAAATNNHLQKHVILDERSAAFTALGIGKATNTPAVLVCTSGTALANYYPAVVEARQSGVPLILATADRPPHLKATGANQAIDQLKIFGDYPVFFHEVGEPNHGDSDLNRLKMLGHQAVSISKEKRGPVHLNFAFRKPLEPDAGFLEQMAENEDRKSSKDATLRSTSIQLSASIQQTISEAEKPLIIVGPLAPKDDVSSIADLADRLHCPVLCESSVDSPNSIHGFAGFLRNEQLQTDLEPDLILRFGFQPTAKSLELAMQRWSPGHHYHFASTHSWQDATFSAAERIPWMGQSLCFGDISSQKNTWLERWKLAEKKFGAHVDKTMLQETALTDGAVYNHVTPQIAEDSFVAVSNSFPARDINLFGKQSRGIPLYLNRGASGIDGVTSTAIGLSLSLQKPGVLFTGDLAFLHDTNALLSHKKLRHPLAIIVINNSGGSIFRMLPLERDAYFKPYFETPQSADIARLVASYNVPYRKIDSLTQLQDFKLSLWMSEHGGLSVIECQTDADASMKLRRELWDF